MPKLDITITISVIVALCATISPIFTAIINNRYQLKLKKMELKQQEYERTVMYERKLYENYLKNAGRCIYYSDVAAQKDYGEAYFAALMLVPDEWRKLMISADKAIAKSDMNAAAAILEKLTPMIRAKLQTW